MRRPAPPSACPDQASLHEAALSHLARYAATAASLVRVLDRRCDRWARAAGDSAAAALPRLRALVRAEVARLTAAGLVDDAAFAARRAASLQRSGRSRRAIVAHLAARGVAAPLARAALPEEARAEFAAALVLARRRHLGPFRAEGAPVERRRELAVFARAGFDEEVARRALACDREQAEALLAELRRG
jgi:regulatory protein